MKRMDAGISALALSAWLIACGPAPAQPASSGNPASPAPPPAASPTAAPAAAPAPTKAHIPEGTEVKLTLGEKLSSSTSTEGDTFEVASCEEIRLPDGTVLPPGYSGRGEVTRAEHNGWLGKSGQLSLRLNYLKIGDTRVHLRGNKSSEGKGNTANLVLATVAFGVIGFAVHGHSVVYPKGAMITAYIDSDTDIALPVPPPPPRD